MTRHALSPSSRRTVGIAGLVAAVAGLVLVVVGAGGFLAGVGEGGGASLWRFAMLVAGILLTVVGCVALNAGFPSASVSEPAEETDTYVRITPVREAPPTCSHCGGANRPGARFCDACGHGLG